MALLVSAPFILGCGSASGSWSELGFSPSEAKFWDAEGFSPAEAKPWNEAGFSPQEAKSWRDHGDRPSDAKPWKEAGFLPSNTDRWRKAEFAPEDAKGWRNAGFSSGAANLLRSNGGMTAGRTDPQCPKGMADPLKLTGNPSRLTGYCLNLKIGPTGLLQRIAENSAVIRVFGPTWIAYLNTGKNPLTVDSGGEVSVGMVRFVGVYEYKDPSGSIQIVPSMVPLH